MNLFKKNLFYSLFYIILYFNLSIQSNKTIVGYGNVLTNTIFQRIIFGYEVSEGDFEVEYMKTNSNENIINNIINNNIDYGIVDEILSDYYYTNYTDIQLYPVFGAAIVPYYNIPGLNTDDDIYNKIVLTRDVLSKIFLGDIIYWNDTKIQILNENTILPYEKIHVVVRSVKSSISEIFTEALSLFSDDFHDRIGTSTLPNWCENNIYSESTNLLTCNKSIHNSTLMSYHQYKYDIDVITAVENIPYSIGYSIYGNSDLNYAKLINKAGNEIDVSETSLSFPIYNINNFEGDYHLDLLDSSASLAWPITTMSYLLLRKNTHENTCKTRENVVKFFQWIYESDVAENIILDDGFVPLPNQVIDDVVDDLTSSIQCLHSDGNLTQAYIENDTTIHVGVSKDIYDLVNLIETVYINTDHTIVYTNDIFDLSSDAIDTYHYSDKEDFIIITTEYNYSNSIEYDYSHLLEDLISHESEHNLFDYNERYFSFPIGSFPLLPLYHLDVLKNNSLNLTLSIIAKIYTGEIDKWDNNLIKEINPNISSLLPNGYINVIYRSDESDSICTIIKILSNYDNGFKNLYLNNNSNNCSLYVPDSIINNNERYTLVDDESHVSSTVSYVDLSFGIWYAIGSTEANIANIYKNDHVIQYNHDSIVACENGVDLEINEIILSDDKVLLQILDPLILSNDDNCWPLLETIIIEIQTNLYSSSKNYDCNNDILSTDFIYWLITDKGLEGSFDLFRGFETIDEKLIKIQNLYEFMITCDDEFVYGEIEECTKDDYEIIVSSCDPKTEEMTLDVSWIKPKICEGGICLPGSGSGVECSYVPFDSITGETLITMIGICVIIIILYMFWFYINRKEKVLKASQIPFMFCFLFGALLHALSSLSYLGNNSDDACLQRYWFWHFSFTLMFSPFFAKLRRVHILFNNNFQKIVIKNWRVAVEVIIVVLIEIILLIIVTYTSKPSSEIIETEEANIGTIDRRVCESITLIKLLPYIYKLILILYGLRLVAGTWNVKAEYSESKALTVALYNFILIDGIVYALILPFDLSYSLVVSLEIFATLWTSTGSVIILLAQKVYQINLRQRRIFSTNKSKSSRNGTKSRNDTKSKVESENEDRVSRTYLPSISYFKRAFTTSSRNSYGENVFATPDGTLGTRSIKKQESSFIAIPEEGESDHEEEKEEIIINEYKQGNSIKSLKTEKSSHSGNKKFFTDGKLIESKIIEGEVHNFEENQNENKVENEKNDILLDGGLELKVSKGKNSFKLEPITKKSIV